MRASFDQAPAMDNVAPADFYTGIVALVYAPTAVLATRCSALLGLHPRVR